MVDQSGRLEPKFLTMLRALGLGFGICLTFLLILIANTGVGDTPPTPIISYSCAAAFLIIGVLNWFWNPFTVKKAAIFYTCFTITGIFSSTFSFGFDNPAVYPAWAALFFATYIFFGIRGGFVYLAMIASATFWLHENLNRLNAEDIIVFVLSLLFEGFLMVLIVFTWRLAEDRLNRLEKSRKIEELEHGRLDALVNSMVDSVVAVNARGVIQMYNAATLSLFDTNKNLHRHHIEDFIHLFDADGKAVDLLELVLASKASNTTYTHLFHHFEDGDKIALSIKSAPISLSFPKKGKGGFAFIFSDITKAKSLDEEKDEFISVVSHELRTPIAIAEASVSNMQFMAKKFNADPRVIEGLSETHSQVIYLAKMINDLSALSRAERSTETEFEKIDVNDLMVELYKEYTPQAQAQGLRLDIDQLHIKKVVKTNKLYLQEILQNLITNAIKYTQHGSVALSAEVNEEGVIFYVKDTGLGISKSDQGKIFEKFYRSEDYRTRETGGTGLGLYVTQKLAQKIGAEISIQSRLNHGSTFSVALRKKK